MNITKWLFISATLFISTNSFSKEININSTFNPKNKKATTLSIPFQLINKLIIVEAYVDGKKGNFIIDTGTNSLILNSNYFSGRANNINRAFDFAGTSMVYRERIVKFNWKNSKIKTYPATVISLASLEKIIGMEIMGYIGHGVLKEFEMMVDYENRNITLFKLGKKGGRKIAQSSFDSIMDSISLKPNGHLPYLTVQVGNQKLKLGIDSGASINMLKTSTSKKLNQYFQPNGFQPIAGFNGKKSLSLDGVLHKLTIENTSWQPMLCIVKEMDDLNKTLPTSLDGLLDFEFLKQHKISINYRKNKMYIWGS